MASQRNNNNHNNNGKNSNKKYKEPLPIDEILFGIDRICPLEILPDSAATPDFDDINYASNHRSSVDHDESDTALSHDDSHVSLHSSSMLSIQDDLSDGRWSVAAANATASSCRAYHHVINLADLRRTASQGIQDAGSHRAVAWRVLLGYLPTQLSQWKTTLHTQRTMYRNLVRDLFVTHQQPDSNWNGGHPTNMMACPLPTRSPLLQHDGNELRGHHSKKAKRRANKQILEADSDDQQQQQQHHQMNSSVNSLPLQRVEEEIVGTTTETAAALPETTPIQKDAEELSIDSISSVEHKLPETTPIQKDTEELSNDSISSVEPKPMSNDDNVYYDDEDESSNQARNRQQTMHNRYHEIVPARIREEWKKAGRESAAIEGLSSVLHEASEEHPRPTHALNTLVATAHITTTLLTEESEDRRWTDFLDSANLLDEIRKDVVRTHPDLFFFLEPEDNLGQRRYAALERVLFVWASLNKGVRYVQGMNEIVGTIYYVMANDFNGEWACEAEPDTYFVFNALMEEMRDIFVPDLDHADTGIQGRLANMQNLLALHDPEIRCHLQDCGIDSSFYAIRWLTTLLSREFLLPDTIRLWDSMFASTHKENFLRYVCVTMVMMVREELLKGDFSTCLRLLQSYPSTNIDQLLESSRALWIYESQITLACHKGGISLHQALQTIAPPPTLVMAYGLRGGVAVTHLEQLEQAANELAASVRDATNVVSNASQGFFGGARRLFFRPRKRSSGSVSSRDSLRSSESFES